MAQFIRQQDQKALEDILDSIIDPLIDDRQMSGQEYKGLVEAYSNFDEGSNTALTLPQLAAAVRPFSVTAADRILSLAWDNIRASNYPSGWDAASNAARNTYQNANLVGPAQPGVWICPGVAPGRPAHQAQANDISIDHIVSVAAHWNNTGHNTDRLTRANWYRSTANHAYMCRACNSSKNSGNIVYRLVTGVNYSN